MVELGCGLALPSLAAARAGAEVLAMDEAVSALALAKRNAADNGLRLETAAFDWWRSPAPEGPPRFDLVLAADVLYIDEAVEPLLELLPRLAPEALLADPGRKPAARFVAEAKRRWEVETVERDVVTIHRLRFG